MSQLAPLLSKLKESLADRVSFAPGEVGYAFTGDAKQPVDEEVISAGRLLEAITEVLSYDELRELPTNRPRIVRYEHGGEEFVLEIVRLSSGLSLGLRHSTARPMRVPSFREAARESIREEAPPPREPPREVRKETPRGTSKAPGDRPPRALSRRKMHALRADKRTLRVELDEEGNPVDSVEVEPRPLEPRPLEPRPLEPRPMEPAPVHTLDTKQFQMPAAVIRQQADGEEGAAPRSAPLSSADRILETMLAIDSLADLPRTGWLLRGIRPCESLADHSFGVTFLAMLLVDAIRAQGGTIDGERTLRMALVHDAAEARTGDIPMPNKTPRMTEALHELEATLIQGLLPRAQREAWAELEREDSLEARVVKAADKAQMMIKALAYERQRRGHLDEFWSNAKNFDTRGVDIARDLFEVLARAAGRTLP